MEEDLQDTIDNIEDDYPDYDEYQYELDNIGHNPYQLAAFLTVLYEDYTREEVQEMLQTIFEYQYTLEIEEEVEQRPVIDEETGEETGDTYDYYILNVTLTNEGIQAAVDALDLTVDQIKRSVKNIFYLMGEKS